MKVVLLDRDGTIIVDPPDERVDSIAKIQLFPDTIEALAHFYEHGFVGILITNQAGIAEGRITESEFAEIHQVALDMLVPSQFQILKTYMCPHGPSDACACRKPNPKMILDAARDFGFEPSEVYMVGDRKSDIDAGRAAGTKTVLVETANVRVVVPEATYTAPNLLDAARYITSHSN